MSRPTYEAEYFYDSFSGLYKRVFDDLEKIDIHSVFDYHQARHIRDNSRDWDKLLSVEFSFSKNMASLLEKLRVKRNDLTGLSLLVDELVPRLSPSQLSKAIAFSNTTYMLREDLNAPECDIFNGDVRVMFGPDISDCLKILFSHEDEVTSGIISPMPDSVSLIDFGQALDDYENARTFSRMRGLENPYTLPSDLIEAPQILPVSLSGQGMGYTNGYLQTGLVLPSLAALDPDTVRLLRQDYAREFNNFQAALCKFARDVKTIDSEQRLILLMQEVESSVAKLNDALIGARRKYASLAGLVSAVCLIFCFSAPSGTAMQALQTALGTIVGGAAANALWHVLDKSARIEQDPYYFPFLIFQKGKNMRERELLG